ncbi:hypothetical protein VB779_12545 [Haloarculaceae archaeon H-GB11]|nr:hypothetical protein [Haloarculaceae archaeon H-GB11]
MSVVGWLVLLAGVGLGLAGLRDGTSRLRVAMAVARSRRSEVRWLADEEGLVQIRGVARRHEDGLTGPVTGKPCLAYRYTVAERRRDSDTDDWTLLERGGEHVPFHVEDESARVLVDPNGAALRLPVGDAVRVEPGQSIESVRRDVLGGDPAARGFDSEWADVPADRERRLTETRLVDGATVSAVGASRYDPSVAEAAGEVNAVVSGADAPIFVVSVGKQSTVLRNYAVRGLLTTLVSVGILGYLGWVVATVAL